MRRQRYRCPPFAPPCGQPNTAECRQPGTLLRLIGFRSRQHYLFKPMVSIGLIVESGDFFVAAGSIQVLRFLQRLVGVEPDYAKSELPRMLLQRHQQAAADAETASAGGDPHA